jgi:NAD(P)-dependent dehydrogenase (short-subunit alcohol dehydrogenase family)
LIDSKRICVITGSSGGVGRDLVNVFSHAGFYVIGVDKKSQRLANKCDFFIKFDLEKIVNSSAYSKLFFNTLFKQIGKNPISVLINNAAIQKLGSLNSLQTRDWQQSISINLLAPFILAKKLSNHLKDGSIINISSIHAKMTKKNFMVYSTSKAALSALTRSLALEMAGNTRVNAIESSAIKTDMLTAGFSSRSSFMKDLIDSHPVKKIGNTEEFAKFVLTIADSKDLFMTGLTIPYDGCISISLPV